MEMVRSTLLRIFEAGPAINISVDKKEEDRREDLWRAVISDMEEVGEWNASDIGDSKEDWFDVQELSSCILTEPEPWYRACIWETMFRRPETWSKVLSTLGYANKYSTQSPLFKIKRFSAIGEIHITSTKK